MIRYHYQSQVLERARASFSPAKPKAGRSAPRERGMCVSLAGGRIRIGRGGHIEVDGRAYKVSPAQALFIECLALRLGSAIPFAEIIDAMWSKYHQPESVKSLLTSHVYQLRRKLAGSAVFIVPCQGHGYRLGLSQDTSCGAA